ncbi:hypothetical protein GCM10009834_23320 [Streptomonospora arabica]
MRAGERAHALPGGRAPRRVCRAVLRRAAPVPARPLPDPSRTRPFAAVRGAPPDWSGPVGLAWPWDVSSVRPGKAQSKEGVR